MLADVATATHQAAALALLLLALTVITAGYLGTCWIWPFGACRRCKGRGRSRSRIVRVFRLCPRCDGTGRRLRLGRHVLNYLRNTHQRSN